VGEHQLSPFELVGTWELRSGNMTSDCVTGDPDGGVQERTAPQLVGRLTVTADAGLDDTVELRVALSDFTQGPNDCTVVLTAEPGSVGGFTQDGQTCRGFDAAVDGAQASRVSFSIVSGSLHAGDDLEDSTAVTFVVWELGTDVEKSDEECSEEFTMFSATRSP
jgi:hypothetical protein